MAGSTKGEFANYPARVVLTTNYVRNVTTSNCRASLNGQSHAKFHFEPFTSTWYPNDTKIGKHTMAFMPFILDRSPTAKLIKAIDSPERQPGQLEQLQQVMIKDILQLPYGYLDQARRRAQSMLPAAADNAERDILQSIYMSALRGIQRIHMESRP